MGKEKKIRIVLASVLKPVTDTRMSEKMAATLAKTGEFDVHVIGYSSNEENFSGVTNHPLPEFRRLSLKRMWMPWKILGMILSLKPRILVITTHELLFIATIAKLFMRCRIIYDIQENYFINIRHTNAFPTLIRPLLAYYVSVKELFLSVFIDHFILAEQSYAHELRFIAKRFTIIENRVRKSLVPPKKSRGDKNVVLLFSGTLDEQTGVFNAIELAVKLYTISPLIRLKIVGYCARQEVLFKIRNTVEPYPFIEMIGGDKLVPHTRILDEIGSADFGVISYELGPSTSGSVPTKLYEYLGARLPILLFAHDPWEQICNRFHAAVVIDRRIRDLKLTYRQMMNSSFYTVAPEGVYWEDECQKFLNVVSQAV